MTNLFIVLYFLPPVISGLAFARVKSKLNGESRCIFAFWSSVFFYVVITLAPFVGLGRFGEGLVRAILGFWIFLAFSVLAVVVCWLTLLLWPPEKPHPTPNDEEVPESDNENVRGAAGCLGQLASVIGLYLAMLAWNAFGDLNNSRGVTLSIFALVLILCGMRGVRERWSVLCRSGRPAE